MFSPLDNISHVQWWGLGLILFIKVKRDATLHVTHH